MKKLPPRLLRLGALSTSLALALPALAQTAPDAGQVLRELQRPAPRDPPPARR